VWDGSFVGRLALGFVGQCSAFSGLSRAPLSRHVRPHRAVSDRLVWGIVCSESTPQEPKSGSAAVLDLVRTDQLVCQLLRRRGRVSLRLRLGRAADMLVAAVAAMVAVADTAGAEGVPDGQTVGRAATSLTVQLRPSSCGMGTAKYLTRHWILTTQACDSVKCRRHILIVAADCRDRGWLPAGLL
jgi:hypothetical protein